MAELLVYVLVVLAASLYLGSFPPGYVMLTLLAWALLWRSVSPLLTIWLSHLYRSPQRPSLAPYEWLRLYGAEWWAAQRLYHVAQLRRQPTRYAPRQTPSAPSLLLVHGYLSNNGFFAHVARQLQQFYPGWIYVPELEPMYSSMESAVAQLVDVAWRAGQESGQRDVILIGHSMGGVAALQFARHEKWRGIAHVICLGAPFAGTQLANLPVFRRFSPGRVGSGLHRRLGEELDSGICAGKPLTNVWSWHDTIVAPQHHARVAGVHNVELLGIGHLEMAFSADILDLLATTLVSINQQPGVPIHDD